MPNLPYSSTSNLPFGGKTVTITAVTYVARNWNPQRRSREIRRNDENGDQAAFQLRSEPISQSGLQLQVPLSTTTLPLMGATFTGPDSVSYVVTAVSPSYPQGEFWMVDIDYKSVSSAGD